MADSRLQLESEYRVVGCEGLVPEDIYVLKKLPDTKLIVLVESGGKRHRMHQERLIPADCFGKTIVVNKVLKTVCPKCRRLANITLDSFVDCGCSGPRHPVQPVDKATRPSFSNKDEITMANQAPTAEIDLAFVASHGVELWSKDLKFDHPTVPTVGYVLLADNPPRKLSFQTYNGTLGKKSTDLGRLYLTEFKDHLPGSKGKTVGYLLKGSLDDERKKLEQLSYTVVGVQQRSTEDVGVVAEAG